MPLSPVDLYEQLKPHLGENESKALIEYVDGKIRGEVATKEDLDLLKKDIYILREDVLKVRSELKEEIWKLRVLVIVVLILEIVLNPKVVEVIGKILGVAK